MVEETEIRLREQRELAEKKKQEREAKQKEAAEKAGGWLVLYTNMATGPCLYTEESTILELVYAKTWHLHANFMNRLKLS